MENILALPLTNQLFIVVGGRPAVTRMLDLVARLASIGQLTVLDGGNHINVYPLARELHRISHDPVKALQNIHLARGFTCFQMVTLIEETAGEIHPGEPVIVLDLLSTFYDENVRFDESCRLFEKCLQSLSKISQISPVIVTLKPPPQDFQERQVFVDRFCQAAFQVWELVDPTPQVISQLALPFG
jgi:hypothetical protein